MPLFANVKEPEWNKPDRSKKICRQNLNPKKDRCGVPNPMNCSTKKKCLFGHALTNSRNYQKSVGCEEARCEFERTKEILENCYGVKVKKKFVCKVK